MFWIHAVPYVARMTHEQWCSVLFIVQVVGNAMCAIHVVFHLKFAVSNLRTCFPRPAFISAALIDLAPESGDVLFGKWRKCSNGFWHLISFTDQVSVAASVPTLAATSNRTTAGAA